MPFRDPTRARENLARLKPRLGRITERSLQTLLAQMPDPDGSLNLLERFFGVAPAPVLDYLGEHGAALHYLLAAFSYSGFLSETLLREPELILRLHGDPALFRTRSREDMLASLRGSGTSPAHWKRREYLRIMLRDVLDVATLSEITLELSELADALLEVTLEQAQSELAGRYGAPASAFTVLSLGKLGGNELNYSSDIDLLFLYRAAGETQAGITHKEYFTQLAGRITGLISAPNPEGRVFRVDLRLRPQGREGEAANSVAAAVDYYRHRARDWELQALVKARHSAGDAALAREFLREVQPLVYRGNTNFAALDSVLSARRRMSESLDRQRSRALDVKLGRGGIRDIEFLGQCLQRLHGGQDPWLRSGATLFALQRLADKGWLSSRDQGTLARAYQFLRVVEHRLQLERDQQTHRLPEDATALDLVARRAGIHKPWGEAGPALLAELGKHMQQVLSIYERVIGGAREGATAPVTDAFTLKPPVPPGEQDYSELLRNLESSRPPLYAALRTLAPQHGGKQLQQFLLNAADHPDALDSLACEPELLEAAATLFEESPYLGDLLAHSPEDVEALRGAFLAPRSPATLPLSPEPPALVPSDPRLEHIAATDAPLTEKMAALRREYRRRLLQIQARSVLAAAPLFETMDATTALAEQMIRAALQAAVAAAPRRAPGAFTVIALGRVGIREFDLASDADLAFFFTLAEPDPEAKVFWIHTAERLISVLSAHTAEGAVFSVDTRLRPRGREGELVDTSTAVEDYFQTRAEPWEAITYMKSRALAGEIETGTDLLTRIQNRIGARFGSGPDAARQLAEMRKRLEATTTPHNFLKTAPGGYYDIDFLLTYLRLQAAGVFYPSLNTLERLTVVERMGQISMVQGEVLREGAIFLRAVQHALRLVSGRSDTELPQGGPPAVHLAHLAERWFPESLQGHPLPEAIEEVMARVRRVFLEVFET